MVVVFGSYNFDVYILETDSLGDDDEILRRQHVVEPGGKGGNQAVAAARAARRGEEPAACGCVGDDPLGTFLIDRLEADNIDVRGISRSPGAATGMGLIFKNSTDKQRVIYAQGANAEARAGAIDEGLLRSAGAILVQGDVPMKENELLIERAARVNTPVVLTLGPDVEISPDALHRVQYVLLNARESELFLKYYREKHANGRAMPKAGSDPQEFCAWFHDAFTCAVVVTRGRLGAVGCDQEGATHLEPALAVAVKDPVGAGDAVAGYFATAIAETLPFAKALRRGVAAGSLACREMGAQSSYATRSEVDELLGENGG